MLKTINLGMLFRYKYKKGRFAQCKATLIFV